MRRLTLLAPEAGTKNVLMVEATAHLGALTVRDGRRFPEADAHRDLWRHLEDQLIKEIALGAVKRDVIVAFSEELLRASVLFRQTPSLKKAWPQLIRYTAAVAVTATGEPGPFFLGVKRDRALVALVGLLAQKKLKIEAGPQLDADIKAQLSRMNQRKENGQPEDLLLMLAYAALFAEHDARPAGGVVSLRFE